MRIKEIKTVFLVMRVAFLMMLFVYLVTLRVHPTITAIIVACVFATLILFRVSFDFRWRGK